MINAYISTLILSMTWMNSQDDDMINYLSSMIKELTLNYSLYLICIILVAIILISNNSLEDIAYLPSLSLVLSICESIQPVIEKSLIYLFAIELLTLVTSTK